MKKTITAIAAALLLAAFGGTTAFAGHCHNGAYPISCRLSASHSCVDADGDGVCDHYAACFTDQDGDGVCDYHEDNRNGFCDADGDGVCDHYAACFTDQDGDGVCDYHEDNRNGFCDADGDGVCDFHEANQNGVCNHRGTAASPYAGHHGHGHSTGRCWR